MTIRGKPVERYPDRYVCAVCGEPLRHDPRPVDLCRFCREDPRPVHFHLRCDRCSPPGWWAAVVVRAARAREEP